MTDEPSVIAVFMKLFSLRLFYTQYTCTIQEQYYCQFFHCFLHFPQFCRALSFLITTLNYVNFMKY